MPDTFLFDIGNVILPFDFGISARKLAEQSGASAEEVFERVAPLMVPLETGALSAEAFVAEASARIGFAGEASAFRNILADIFDPNLAMIAFIEGLKAEGVRLCLLSNTNAIHADFFEREYPVFGLFDGAVYSHEAGFMKPDPAIFAHTIEKLSLDPAATIYVDDLAANCEAGRTAGFRSLLYDRSRHADFLAAVAEIRS